MSGNHLLGSLLLQHLYNLSTLIWWSVQIVTQINYPGIKHTSEGNEAGWMSQYSKQLLCERLSQAHLTLIWMALAYRPYSTLYVLIYMTLSHTREGHTAYIMALSVMGRPQSLYRWHYLSMEGHTAYIDGIIWLRRATQLIYVITW